jgi:hypothetical protein
MAVKKNTPTSATKAHKAEKKAPVATPKKAIANVQKKAIADHDDSESDDNEDEDEEDQEQDEDEDDTQETANDNNEKSESSENVTFKDLVCGNRETTRTCDHLITRYGLCPDD